MMAELNDLISVGDGKMVCVVHVGTKGQWPLLTYSPRNGYRYLGKKAIVVGRCMATRSCDRWFAFAPETDGCEKCKHMTTDLTKTSKDPS